MRIASRPGWVSPPVPLTFSVERVQAMPYLFTLIHGTFAVDAEWVTGKPVAKGEESFRGMLETAFAGDAVRYVDDLEWGHRGLAKVLDLTDAARRKGTAALEEKILAQPAKKDREDDQRHFLIAHSHGGNVALLALKNPAVRDRVDGLVCMATPFLFPRRRPVYLPFLWTALVLLVLNLWAPELAAAPLRGVGIELGTSWLGALLGLFGVVADARWPALVMWIQVAALGLLLSWITYFRHRLGEDALAAHIDRLSFAGVDLPVLLVRSSGDEATGLLRMGQFLNWLSGKLVAAVSSRGFWLFAYLLTLALVKALLAKEMAMQPGVGEIAERILAVFVRGLNLVGFFLLSLVPIGTFAIAVSRLLVGLDSGRWAGELETMIEDGPPGLPAEIAVSVPGAASAHELAHSSVYARPETAQEIARWCRGL